MLKALSSVLVVALAVSVQADDTTGLFERVLAVLQQRYHDQRFRETRLPELAEAFKDRARRAGSLQRRREVVFDFLSRVPASHLSLLSGASYRRLMEELWARPTPTLGFELAELGGDYFACNVLDGGPAMNAGLLTGDRVMTIDGRPVAESDRLDWRTDDAFLDDPPLHAVLVEDGSDVRLEVERGLGERHRLRLGARPVSLLEASRASVRVLETDGVTVGYYHLWLVPIQGAREALKAAMEGPLARSAALLLDLRGRGGSAGAVPQLLGLLAGPTAAWDRPVVALVDRGTRSAKEVLAYELKQSARALLVGEPTAGAVVPAVFEDVGEDTVLMLPAFKYPRYTDLLEGKPVVPDTSVSWSLRYAAGHDPILEAGLGVASTLARRYRGSPASGAGPTAAVPAPTVASGGGDGLLNAALPDPHTLIARMVEALGGEERIRAHKAITRTGTFEVEGTPLSGTIVIRSAPPYRFRSTLELPGIGRIEQGFDGKVAWSESPMAGRRVLQGLEREQLRNQASFFGPLAFRDHYSSIQVGGDTACGTSRCHELKLGYDGGHTTTLLVDAETSLVVGTRDTVSVMGREIEEVTTLSAYREFDGLKIPTLVVTELVGVQRQRLSISDVSFADHEARAFDPPEWALQVQTGAAGPG